MKWVICFLLVYANVLLFGTAYAPKVLKVTFLNVGDGEAILVEAPSGTNVLINAGPDASVLRALGEALPFWKRSLSLLLKTNSTAASVGGVPEVLHRYHVGKVMDGKTLRRGTRLDLGSGASIDILLPSHEEEAMALRLAYGETSFFISSDLSESERGKLSVLDAKDGELVSDIFFVPHQGASGSVTKEWLMTLRPKEVVISVGAQNRYQYPATTTLETLEHAGLETFRTDVDGAVTFVSDGITVHRE